MTTGKLVYNDDGHLQAATHVLKLSRYLRTTWYTPKK